MAILGLALLAANHGDYAQAFIQLREAERLMQQRQVPDAVYRAVLLLGQRALLVATGPRPN